jgi:hypothetical protein
MDVASDLPCPCQQHPSLIFAAGHQASATNAPQIKIVDGQIVVDEASLVVQAQQASEPLLDMSYGDVVRVGSPADRLTLPCLQATNRQPAGDLFVVQQTSTGSLLVSQW